MGDFRYSSELYHHGVKGMKWGVRRYQNKDGSLTPAGRKRQGLLDSAGDKIRSGYQSFRKKQQAKRLEKAQYKEAQKQAQRTEKNKKRKLSELTDDELKAVTARNRLETEYLTAQNQRKEAALRREALNPKPISKGKKFADGIAEAAVPALKKAGGKLLEDFLTKKGSELLGLNSKDTKNAMDALKKEAEEWDLKGKIAEGKNKVDARNEKAKAKADADKRKKEKAVDDDIDARMKDMDEKNEAERKTREANTFDGEIINDSGSSHKWSKNAAGTGKTYTKKYDTIYTDDFVDKTDYSSGGRDYVSGYLNSPVAGLLSSPEED